MKKELLALLASLLVIAIVVSAASALCSPKRHNYGSDWGEFLQEEENTIDVLFIGSSLEGRLSSLARRQRNRFA